MRPHPKDYRRRSVLLTAFSVTALLLCTGIFAGNAAMLTAPPTRAAEKPDSTVPEFTPRTLRYKPEGTDFVIHNGHKKYNRALYGTHTAFRVEAGDLPEFALYMPGIGGDLKLGILTSRGSKWLNDFDSMEARYRPGTMLYRLRDSLLGTEVIHLQLLAMADREGMLLKAWVSGKGAQNGPPPQLVYAYGGASGMHPSRNGDLGADPPSVFYLTPAHARGNRFTLGQGGFTLDFKDRDQVLSLQGTAPVEGRLHIGDARRLKSPRQAVKAAASAHTPVLICQTTLKNNTPVYFAIQRKDSLAAPACDALPGLFALAETARQALAGRVRIHTPDPFLNTLGGTLSVAADAIWQSPAYLHGAVAWRMWLNGWRGPYCADPLGWHDRAKTDFSAYNAMQLTAPDTTIPYADPTYHLARQKEKIGVGIYNSGYITRHPTGKRVPHHYDMNLVYIDALLRHFLWTRDTAFLRRCWPVIKRDLSWEKRNFDGDSNGLYDAYACIWASDALQYSGGDVAYSSAFNYFANHMAARIAAVLGADPAPYRREAGKIRHAMDSLLWMPHKGWYAEYKDREGLRLLHPSAGLWTIYHTVDSKVPDAFRAYQCLRYIDTRIPHIPIHCAALKGTYEMLSTTDWMPYTWSVNNVSMAEMAHTALAYWEGGRKKTACRIFKSLLLESQYLGSSPGNFEQLSYYDRNRGELYRDFADPIGICSRALVEGLFGIQPDQLADTLRIRPGFPPQWREASIHLPDIDYHYRRDGLEDNYTITPAFHDPMNLKLQLDARGCAVQSVRVNGKPVSWQVAACAVGTPQIVLSLPPVPQYHITIQWNTV
ncbi:MAG TPA: DUF4450 domain-containing protein, partial [Chitinophagaceae bacterium]|nr:DUF4450 domain-containing protein [Chitinophagaceae bacterium]